MTSSRLDAVDFELPAASIAQHPLTDRATSRLLRWSADGSLEHLRFSDLPELLNENDLLVLNDTKVVPARLHGTKVGGSAAVEILLVRPRENHTHAGPGGCVWEAMIRPGRRLPDGSHVQLPARMVATIVGRSEEHTAFVSFSRDGEAPDADAVIAYCHAHGHVPLPPYIERPDESSDRDRYQTVFAREDGSVAAPTAGLHFTASLLEEIESRQVEIARVTLHVGPGTFRPLDDADLVRGVLHAERYAVEESTVEAIAACRARGGRVVAVGTTVCRTLETIASGAPLRGETRLMIQPPHDFTNVDVLITNFHLPRSSLLLLVSALAGERWRTAYELAIRVGYRFYSYGDANWIERALTTGARMGEPVDGSADPTARTDPR